MSRIAGLVVRALPGAHALIRAKLDEQPEIEVVADTGDGLAVVMTAGDVQLQEVLHKTISGWPGVLEVVLTFQSGEIADEAEVHA